MTSMRYFIALLCVISTFAFAGTPDQLPNDSKRGTWFDTIDEDARDYAWNRITDTKRKGDTALRFELRHGDCYTSPDWDDCTQDRERTEVRERWSPPLDKEVWYSFSFYIPNDYEWMYPKQMFFQWHGGVWGPNAYFQLKRDEFLVDILTKRHETTTQYNLGKLDKGKWHDFVVKVKWTTKQNGYMTVYLKGKALFDHKGPTMDSETYAKGRGPHVKFGIYRSHLFRWTESRNRPTHILYFDEYRHGYSYDDVAIEKNRGD